MSKTKQKKIDKRLHIIKTAVDLFERKGVNNITLKQIAKKADVSLKKLSQYFADKEDLIYTYYEIGFETVIDQLIQTKSFNKFTLQEQIHAFLEYSLEYYAEHRSFVRKTFTKTVVPTGKSLKQTIALRKQGKLIFHEFLASAIEINEIPKPISVKIVENLLYDYYCGVVQYWLKDKSKKFNRTSIFIDKTLEIIILMLHNEITNKIADLFSYLFKTHFSQNMKDVNLPKDIIKKMKAQFLEMTK